MMVRRFAAVIFVLAAMLVVSDARAGDGASLKERFRERYPLIVELKKNGTVGETFDGMVEAVKASSRSLRIDKDKGARAPRTVGELLDAENADRRTLYQRIAEKTGSSPELVAKRNAQRNFERAGANELFKLKSGKWKRKGDIEKSEVDAHSGHGS